MTYIVLKAPLNSNQPTNPWRLARPDFNVVACCLLFFLQNRHRQFADAYSLMFQHAPMLPIFDVRCVHRPNSNINRTEVHGF